MVNSEHREGSKEQALAFFNEQLEGKTAEHYASLLANLYNFTMSGNSRVRVVETIKMTNGKTLYLTGEIR